MTHPYVTNFYYVYFVIACIQTISFGSGFALDVKFAFLQDSMGMCNLSA